MCLLCHLGFILHSVLFNVRSPKTCSEARTASLCLSYLFLICFIPWLQTSSVTCTLLSKILFPYMFSKSIFSADGAVGWGTALQVGRSRVQFSMVSLELFIDIILPAALWPWGRLSLQINEYQEYFLGGKGDGYVGLTTLPPSSADCL